MIAKRSEEQRRSRRRLLWGAIATLVIGLLPFISSLLVLLIAPQLGCLVIEHGAYTRGPSFGDDPGDLTLGCIIGGVDVGPALHAMHLFIFAIFFTWPFLLMSLVLWVLLLIERRGPAEREM